MQLELPKLIEGFLKKRGLGRRQVAERMGYRNLNRGMRHVTAWLRGEALPCAAHIDLLAPALEVPRAELEALVRRDAAAVAEEARRRRARDPRFYLTVRYAAAIYVTEVLGEGLDEQAALAAAAARAAQVGRRCCLSAPSSRCYWLSATGALEDVDRGPEPTLRVGGRAFRLLVEG